MTHDTPEAVLEAALHDHKVGCVGVHGFLHAQQHREDAAAIFAALDGWTLVPVAEVVIAAEEVIAQRAEIVRLQKALDEADSMGAEIARLGAAVVRYGAHMGRCQWRMSNLEEECSCGFDAVLDAALAAQEATPKS